MKTLVKTSLVLLALSAATTTMAQEVTQAQKDGSAALVTQCVKTKAPANWELMMTAIDRSNAPKLVVYNQARVAKTNQIVDIPVADCNTPKQVNDLLQFQAVIPATQKDWKVLYLTTNVKGEYQVFTDVGLAQTVKK